MEKFTYKNKYGNCKNCYFRTGNYANNDAVALEIWNDKGPVLTCTVNLDFPTNKDEAHIKTYSENEGVLEFLMALSVVKEVVRWRHH